MTNLEYTNMLLYQFNKLDPILNYRKESFARKNNTCFKCDAEIHKNEHIKWIKPNPTYNKCTKTKTYYKWVCLCYDCDIKRQSELELYYE